MEDLRYSILGSMISKKLGLSKKYSKIQAEVNGIVHDISKKTSQQKLDKLISDKSSLEHV
jgi:HD superfamily phosphohydrolase YqeK